MLASPPPARWPWTSASARRGQDRGRPRAGRGQRCRLGRGRVLVHVGDRGRRGDRPRRAGSSGPCSSATGWPPSADPGNARTHAEAGGVLCAIRQGAARRCGHAQAGGGGSRCLPCCWRVVDDHTANCPASGRVMRPATGTGSLVRLVPTGDWREGCRQFPPVVRHHGDRIKVRPLLPSEDRQAGAVTVSVW